MVSRPCSLNGRTHAPTNGRKAESNMFLFCFFKIGGIKIEYTLPHVSYP